MHQTGIRWDPGNSRKSLELLGKELYIYAYGIDLFYGIRSSVFPENMKEPIFSVGEVDGTLCRVGLYDVSAFSSESPSSFESENYIWLPNGHYYAVGEQVERELRDRSEGRVSDWWLQSPLQSPSQTPLYKLLYNAIWRLLYWWRSDLGRTFTAGRRRWPWNGQRYHEKGASYQVSPLNLSNVFVLGFIS